MVLSNLAKLYAHTDRPEQQRVAAEAANALFEPLVGSHAGDPDYVLPLDRFLDCAGGIVSTFGPAGPGPDHVEERSMPPRNWHEPIPRMATIDIWSQISPIVWRRSTTTSGISPPARPSAGKGPRYRAEARRPFPGRVRVMFYMNNIMAAIFGIGSTTRLALPPSATNSRLLFRSTRRGSLPEARRK